MEEEYFRCVEDLKMYMGLPPYDRGSNLVIRDPIFRSNINNTYTPETLRKAENTVKTFVIKWSAVRNKFIKETSGE